MKIVRAGILDAIVTGLVFLAGQTLAFAQPLAPDIVVTKTINAPVAEVWKAWTTANGIESFLRAQGREGRAVAGRRLRVLVRRRLS